MKRSLSALPVCILLLFAACNKTSTINEVSSSSVDEQRSQLLTTQQINAFIKNVIDAKGGFSWSDAPDLVVYSAIMHSDDHMVSVGYKPLDEINVEDRLAKINIHDNKWAFAKA